MLSLCFYPFLVSLGTLKSDVLIYTCFLDVWCPFQIVVLQIYSFPFCVVDFFGSAKLGSTTVCCCNMTIYWVASWLWERTPAPGL